MQRFIVWGVGILVVLGGGFFLLNNYIYQEKQADVERDTVSGVVVGVNVERVAFDGPAVLTIQTDSGETRSIEIPSMGLPLCEAFEYIADVYAIEAGDFVEITGDVNPESGAIVPCGSVEHYLRATATYTDETLGLQFKYRKGPDGYILQTAPHGNEEESDYEETYILMLQDDYEALQAATDAREGPPTINISVYRNSENARPAIWADANPSVSNIGLALAEPAEAVIAGANAVRYNVDGLYPTDTVVVADGGFIFVISGSYLEEDSTIRQDFEPFLESIVFVQRPGEE